MKAPFALILAVMQICQGDASETAGIGGGGNVEEEDPTLGGEGGGGGKAVAPPAAAAASSDEMISVIWVDEEETAAFEASYKEGGGGGERAALTFRDVVTEKTAKRMFENFLAQIRVHGSAVSLTEELRLIKTTTLYNISMVAEEMVLRGLPGMKLKYFRVIRHFGLKDIEAIFRIGATDFQIEGKYNLTGDALGFLPVIGTGAFKVVCTGLSLSAFSFLILNSANAEEEEEEEEGDQLVIRDLDVSVSCGKIDSHFENLLGNDGKGGQGRDDGEGGFGVVVGSAANLIAASMGEAIVEAQKKNVARMLKARFKEEVSKFL